MSIILAICVAVSLLVVDSTYWYAAKNPKSMSEREHVLRDVKHCMILGSSSAMEYLRYQFKCLMTKMDHCILKPSFQNNNNLIENGSFLNLIPRYRGLVAADGASRRVTKHILNIWGLKGYFFNLAFLIFNFEWIPHTCNKHGVAVKSGNKTDTVFCGKRLEWRMLLTNNQVKLSMRTTPFRHYNLKMFYSSLRYTWITSICEVNVILSSTPTIMQNYPLRTIINPYIFEYYILIGYFQRMSISCLMDDIDDTDIELVVHDGPGSRSSRLIEQSEKEEKAETTTFSAFVRITRSSEHTTSNITVKINIIQKLTSFNSCSISPQVLEFSNYLQNKICYIYIDNLRSRFPAIFVHRFVFDGPLFMGEQASSDCQYGGLYITLQSVTSPEIIACSNKSEVYIYSSVNSIRILLVWFSGYSSGSLSGTLLLTKCWTRYESLVNKLVGSVNIINESSACQIFICAPLVQPYQDHCHVLIRSKSAPIGPADLTIFLQHTFSTCISEYGDIRNRNQLNVSASFITNWPLNQGIQTKNVSRNITSNVQTFVQYSFDYLQYSRITLPYMCDKSHPMTQLSVTLQIPYCNIDSNGVVTRVSLRNIQLLNVFCIGILFHITNVQDNIYYLILKEGDASHNGTLVPVYYNSECPIQCRNGTYTLDVLNKTEQSVYRYTANIGVVLLTGFMHDGLRLSIPFARGNCSHTCSCSANLQKTSIKTDKNADRQLWRLHSKR